MNRRSKLVALAGLAVLTAVTFRHSVAEDTRVGKPSSEKTATTDRLAPFAWMQGTWSRTQGHDYLEESWSAPAGDCMQGMFRWIKDGKLWMVELMTITVDDGTPVFRLRHFDRRQVAWEEKDGALTYPLKQISTDEVRFEDPTNDKTRAFVFARPSADEYEVRLVPAPGGKGNATSFRFKRKAD